MKSDVNLNHYTLKSSAQGSPAHSAPSLSMNEAPGKGSASQMDGAAELRRVPGFAQGYPERWSGAGVGEA